MNICYVQQQPILAFHKSLIHSIANSLKQKLIHLIQTTLFFQNEVNESSLSSKLRTTLKRIQDNLILDSEGSPVTSPGSVEDKHDKIGHPHISPIVDLGGIDKLFGLTERVVATESL